MSEQIHGPSPAGSVVLNLGADVGALILRADASLLGAEIEISPADPGGHPDHFDDPDELGHPGHPGHPVHPHRIHSMVRERHTLPHPRYDAVYPDLKAGRYTIWRDADTPGATVTITGGQITTHTLTHSEDANPC